MDLILWFLRFILIVAACSLVVFGFEKKKNAYKAYGVIVALFIIVTFCVAVVPANNVGVKWSVFSGTSTKTLSEGMVLKTPFDQIYVIPTTVQERTMEGVTVQTNDAQFLTMEVNVKFNVDKENAFMVYKRYGTIDNLKENIISNYSQKAIETVVTQYNIIDVLGEKKNEIYDLATEALELKLSNEGINLVELTIKDMDAGETIEKAIQNEAVAKKNLDTAKQEQEKAQIEAQTKLIEAQGEAEANKVLSESITENLIKMKEAEARMEHGWVTVQGSNSTAVIKE